MHTFQSRITTKLLSTRHVHVHRSTCPQHTPRNICLHVPASTCPQVYMSTWSTHQQIVHTSTCPHIHKSTRPQVHRFTLPHVYTLKGSPVHRSAHPDVHMPDYTSTGSRHTSIGPHIHIFTGPHIHMSICPLMHSSTCPQLHSSSDPHIYRSAWGGGLAQNCRPSSISAPAVLLLAVASLSLLFHFSAHVCCTDLPEVVPLIELNRTINQRMITGTFMANSLKW